MSPKILGSCSKCDAEVFEVAKRDPETRVPIQLGPCRDDAMRATFLLLDGSSMDLTFCKNCSDTLLPHDYRFLWQRVMLSWETETPGHPNQKQHADNGILALRHVQPWKDIT